MSMAKRPKNIIIEKIIRNIFWNLNGKVLTVPNIKLVKGSPPLTLHHGPSLAAFFLSHLKQYTI